MRQIFPIVLLFIYVCLPLKAGTPPDFAVTDIQSQGNGGFITIKMQNLSTQRCQVTPPQKEKVFLTIYIDNVKRAEYKLKYLDQKLLIPKRTISFRTNFRVSGNNRGMKIKAVINPLKIIPERNYRNNTLEKKLPAARR